MKEKHPPLKEDFAPRRFSLFAKPLSQTLALTLKPVYKKHGFAESRILTEWNTIVGAELAGWSLPQKLSLSRGKQETGTLHVLVAAGRALELQHMQPVILDRIATYFGHKVVTKLVFTQAHGPLFRKKPVAAVKPKAPADDALVSLTAACEDERLRNALLSLGQTLAAVEK